MNRTTLALAALALVAVALIVLDAPEPPPPPAAPVPAAGALPEGHPSTDGVEPVRAGPLDGGGGAEITPGGVPGGAALREGPGTGRVLEVTPSASFTILKVDRDGTEVWITGPALQVSVGDEVEWDSASVVHDFPSATAGRTFDTLLFADGIRLAQTG